RLQLQPEAGGFEHVRGQVAVADEGLVAADDFSHLQVGGVGGHVLQPLDRAAHAAALAVLGEGGHDVVAVVEDLVGARRVQLHVERGAVTARGAVLRGHLGAVGRGHLDRAQLHGRVVSIEQVVGNGGVHRHPHVGARHVGGGGQDPGAVRAGGGGSHGENGGGGEAGCEIPEAAGHGWFPYFFRLSLIAPSSEPPLADRLSPPFGG